MSFLGDTDSCKSLLDDTNCGFRAMDGGFRVMDGGFIGAVGGSQRSVVERFRWFYLRFMFT